MLKVECESCKAPYQVDERRVPPTGLKMRCPKCGHTFLVTDPSKGSAPATEGAAKSQFKKATMMGLAPKPVPAPKATPFADKPTAPAMTAVKPPQFGGLDDLDLPAVPGAVDLPAPVARAKGAKPAPPAPAPFAFEVDLPAPPSGGFGDLDLPAPKPAPPKAAPKGGFGELPDFDDLPAVPQAAQKRPPPPSPQAFGEIDLPSLSADGFDLPSAAAAQLPARTAAETNLPARGGAPPGAAHLPAPVRPDAHLPTASGAGAHLPTPAGLGAHLPSATGPGAHLPSATGHGAHLPSAMGPGAHLPSAMGPGAHLPSAMGPGAHLPSAMGPGAHLPQAMPAGAHLPSAMGAAAHMPQPVSDERLLPSRSGAHSAFGELDLPLVGAADPLAPPVAAHAFGEVDLPADPLPLPHARTPSIPASAGGMAFGEVDLGGSSDGPSAPLGPPPAMSAGTFAFQEASLEGPRDRAGPRAGREPDARSSRLPKILGAAVVLVVVGGAALQLTPVGAFGHLWISDKLHAGENVQVAAKRADETRKKLALDTFAAAQGAADELFDARTRSPRSRPLGAYAAFVEYAKQLRFGIDPARAARVNGFIVDVPPDTEVPYLLAAQAAQQAQVGEWDKAKKAIEIASMKEPKDGIQQELNILKGEVALHQRDPAAALAAFSSAHSASPSARTWFGLARAHVLANAYPKAKEAVDAALKASPTHAGALTLRAQLAFEVERNEKAATQDLAAVLDDKNKASLGSAEVAAALTTRGWILLARDRSGDARAAFDEAVKIDPRNVSALVGQGEVLYADGRATEAFTRFEEAVRKDPGSVPALIGSAKAQIALEHLSDAKTLLVSARQRAPKDMAVALWLARVEDALGNRKAAEELFATSIDLADPKNPDAIQAYAAFAQFLAAQGKKDEAAAKLEQARAKLPDTAALQRAFGEVAVAQGQFAQALEHFESALAKNPADLGTRFRLGVTYRKMHKLDLAAKALDEVAAIDKEYPGIALERGLLFEESGDVQKALEQFQSASQKAPNDIDLMLRVGAAYVAIGDTEKALPLLVQVKDKRPNSAEANHFVGRAYLKQGGLEQAAAMRYLQRAVALDPNKAEYHLYVAWAANEAQPAQLGLARTHIEKALSIDKLLADAYWQRGVLERKEGATNDAIKDLKRALELKPARHEAHATLAEAFEDKNDLAAATAEWQRAISGDEKPAFWRFKYGKILADRNQNAEAARHLVYAVDKGKSAQPRPGWLSTAAFEAGDALKKTGQKKDACEHFRLFLELAPPSSPDRRDAAKSITDLACPSE